MPTDAEIDAKIEEEFGKRNKDVILGDHWSDEYRTAVKAKIDARAQSIDKFWEKVNTLPPEVGLQFSKINAELTEATYRTQQALMIRFPWVDAEPAERRVLYKQFETYYTAARDAQRQISEKLSKMLDEGKPIENFDWLTYYKDAGIGFTFDETGKLSEVKFLIADDFGNTPAPIKTQMWLDEFRRVLRSGKSGISDKDALVNFTHITRQEAEQILKFPKPPTAKVFTTAEVLADPAIKKLWEMDAPIGKWDDPVAFIDPNKTPLRGTKYAIISVDNPNGEMLSEAENLLRQQKFEEMLTERGLKFQKLSGSYGAPETSYLIIGANQTDALEFGDWMGKTQQSVLTQDGMIFLTGDHQGEIMLPNWEDGIDFSSGKSDYYTEFVVGDQKIKTTLPYRFDDNGNPAGTLMDLNDFNRPDYEEIVRQIARKYDPRQIGGTTGLAISKVLHDYLHEVVGSKLSFKGVGLKNLKKVLEHLEFEGYIGSADNFTSLVVNAFNAKVNKTIMKEVPELANTARAAMKAGFIEAGQTPEQVDLLVEMTDFFSKQWAERTGKTADEFWLYQWAGIAEGERVDLTPHLLYNEVGEPIWYSPLQNAIQNNLKDGKYPDGMAVLARLKAIPGIKQEELEVTGIVDWLSEITKKDLEDGIWVGNLYGESGQRMVHELTPEVILEQVRSRELNMVDDLSVGSSNQYYNYTLKTGPEDTYFIHKFVVPDAPNKQMGHFTTNDVAWVRGNTVTVQTKNGPMKFLMIDEIQSDIHEGARDVVKQLRWDLYKKYSTNISPKTKAFQVGAADAYVKLLSEYKTSNSPAARAVAEELEKLIPIDAAQEEAAKGFIASSNKIWDWHDALQSSGNDDMAKALLGFENELSDRELVVLDNLRNSVPDISDPSARAWLQSQLNEDELALLNSGGYLDNWYKYAQNKWDKAVSNLQKKWGPELDNPPYWKEFQQSVTFPSVRHNNNLNDLLGSVKDGNTAYAASDIKDYANFLLNKIESPDDGLADFMADLEFFRLNDGTVNDSFLTNSKAVLLPKYPFSKNYTEMAARRMVRKAIDDGLEGVSWTTGAQQVERYGNVEIKWKQIGTPENPEWEIFTVFNHNGQKTDHSIGKIKNFEDIRNLNMAEISSNWAETLWKKIKLNSIEREITQTITGDDLVKYDPWELKYNPEKEFMDSLKTLPGYDSSMVDDITGNLRNGVKVLQEPGGEWVGIYHTFEYPDEYRSGLIAQKLGLS